MDILNFISWIKGGRQVSTVDASKTLIPVGLKDGRRDDGYLAGAISVEDLAAQIGGGGNLYTSIVGKFSMTETIIYENTTGQTFTVAYNAMQYKWIGSITNTDINKIFILNSIQGVPGASATPEPVFKFTQNGANLDFELNDIFFGSANFQTFEIRVYN